MASNRNLARRIVAALDANSLIASDDGSNNTDLNVASAQGVVEDVLDKSGVKSWDG